MVKSFISARIKDKETFKLIKDEVICFGSGLFLATTIALTAMQPELQVPLGPDQAHREELRRKLSAHVSPIRRFRVLENKLD